MVRPALHLQQRLIKDQYPVARYIDGTARDAMVSLAQFLHFADDVISDISLTADQRHAYCQQMLKVLAGESSGETMLDTLGQMMRGTLIQHQLSVHSMTRIIQGFQADIHWRGAETYSDLNLLMQYIAAPIGEMLVALFKLPPEYLKPAQDFCISLQLLKYWQNVGVDYRVRQRLYLPRQWLREAGVDETQLSQPKSPIKMRAVYRRLSQTIRQLQHRAYLQLKHIPDKKVRRELKFTWLLARSLHRKLKWGDPCRNRPFITRLDILWAHWLSRWNH